MTSVTLDVPADILSAAQQIAEALALPLEEVLLSRLKSALSVPSLPADEEAELEALKSLSDDALWTIAREQLPVDVQTLMESLMPKNALGTISADERLVLEQLVDRGQRLMLRRSEATALLRRRGYTLSPLEFINDA